ncbi:MAG: serine/threonine protein kinase, partial [Terriglobia bacterium]
MKSCPSCQSTYPGHFSMCPRDGTALVDAEEWSSGMVIRGKYRILNKIGQGGMGGVYKAHHVMFEELRALKVMNPDLLGNAGFVRRFKQEAVIARKLQHANAVRVDDIDEAEDGRPFIVMEYIEGKSLKSVIQEQGRLPVDRACSIAKQVAAALDAAHQLGMVHRDIKPANIVLIHTPAGEQAKVLDFGIAKLKEAHATEAEGMTLTGTGIVIGTPQYMSPEQAAGKRGDQLDGRSDIYSLGVVMYQMLTGELPFKADTTIELILAQINTPPRPILEVHPDFNIPPAVAQLVMRCLEKKPEMRPSSGSRFISQIQSVGDVKWEWETVPTRTTSFPPSRAVTREARKAIMERNERVAQSAEDQLYRPSTGARPKPEPRLRSSEHAVPPASIPEPPSVGAPAGKGHRWVLPVAAALVIAAGMAAWQLEIRRHVTSINLAAAERSQPASHRGSAGSRNSKADSSSGPPTKQSAVASPSAPSVSSASAGELSSSGQHSGAPSSLTSPPSQGDMNVSHPARQPFRGRFIRNRETVAALRRDERRPDSPREVENQSLAGLIVNTAPGAAVFLDGKRVGMADHEG